MSALVLYGPTERSTLPRWSAAAVVVVLLHAMLIAAGVLWYVQYQNAGTPIPPIMVDLVPVSAAPETQPLDIAPGSTMQEAPERQVQPDQPVLEKHELIPPTPTQDKPVVVAPLEQKQEKVKPDPRAKPDKPKPVQQTEKKPSESKPAPRTTAAPQAEQRAPARAAAAGAVSAAAAASYAQRLVAHLQRFKQYPAASRAAGHQGTTRVAFTVTRGGGVSSVRIAGSSGHAELDAETLAMIRRAQPLPSFPPEMTESSKAFVLPMNYSVR